MPWKNVGDRSKEEADDGAEIVEVSENMQKTGATPVIWATPKTKETSEAVVATSFRRRRR